MCLVAGGFCFQGLMRDAIGADTALWSSVALGFQQGVSLLNPSHVALGDVITEGELPRLISQ